MTLIAASTASKWEISLADSSNSISLQELLLESQRTQAMLKLWKDYELQRKAKKMHNLNASAALVFPKCTALRWQLRSLCCWSHVCETVKDACHDCHGLGISIGHWSCQIHFQWSFVKKRVAILHQLSCQSFPASAPKTRIFPKFPASFLFKTKHIHPIKPSFQEPKELLKPIPWCQASGIHCYLRPFTLSLKLLNPLSHEKTVAQFTGDLQNLKRGLSREIRALIKPLIRPSWGTIPCPNSYLGRGGLKSELEFLKKKDKT